MLSKNRNKKSVKARKKQGVFSLLDGPAAKSVRINKNASRTHIPNSSGYRNEKTWLGTAFILGYCCLQQSSHISTY